MSAVGFVGAFCGLGQLGLGCFLGRPGSATGTATDLEAGGYTQRASDKAGQGGGNASSLAKGFGVDWGVLEGSWTLPLTRYIYVRLQTGLALHRVF